MTAPEDPSVAEPSTAPPLPTGFVAALLQHSNRWGPAWFGLIFLGSVLNALSRELWPNTDDLLIATASAGLGLAAGLAAVKRGFWL